MFSSLLIAMTSIIRETRSKSAKLFHRIRNINSAFEVATCSPLALLYSFESVLERHHSHMCHFLINDPQCNILNRLNFAEKSEMRSILTHAILSTDMAKHADEMELLYKCAANNPPFDKTDKKSRYMLISFILHSAGESTSDNSRIVNAVFRYWRSNSRYFHCR